MIAKSIINNKIITEIVEDFQVEIVMSYVRTLVGT